MAERELAASWSREAKVITSNVISGITATHRLGSELNGEGDVCQTTSNVAFGDREIFLRCCQS